MESLQMPSLEGKPENFRNPKKKAVKKFKVRFEKLDNFLDKKMKWPKYSNKKKNLKPHLPCLLNDNTNNIDQYSKTAPFRDFDSLMDIVRRKYKSGGFADTITQMKENDRRRKLIADKCQPPPYIIPVCESDDEEELKHVEFVQAIIYKHKGEDVNSIYWLTGAVVQYLKMCGHSGTLLALCILRKISVTDTSFIKAVRDMNAIPLLLNILSEHDVRCKVLSLKVLRDLCVVQEHSLKIITSAGVRPLIQCLAECNSDIKCLAADIISVLAVISVVRLEVSQYNGIPYLVHLMNVQIDKISQLSGAYLTMEGKVAQCAATALWAISKSPHNRVLMRESGIFPLLSRLLMSGNPGILIPVIGTLQQCSNEQYYKVSIRTEGMIDTIVKHLKSNYMWLKIQCGLTLFSCCEDPYTQVLMRESGGLDTLVEIMTTAPDAILVYGITGIVWKCSKDVENAQYFEKLDCTKIFVNMLQTMPKDIMLRFTVGCTSSEKLKRLEHSMWIAINITGGLSELARIESSKLVILHNQGLETLINMLEITERLPLMINIVRTLGVCADLPECTASIIKLGGLRRLISYMKHPRPEVQAAACWALVPCFKNAKDLDQVFDSFIGCLEITVDLLLSDDEEVLCATCSYISVICKNKRSLQIVTDLQIVERLAALVSTSSSVMLYYLSKAIAEVARLPTNARKFGEIGALKMLLEAFSRNPPYPISVETVMAYAFYRLSSDAHNCMEMYRLNLMKMLLKRSHSQSTTKGGEENRFTKEMVYIIGNIRKVMAAIDNHTELKKIQTSLNKLNEH